MFIPIFIHSEPDKCPKCEKEEDIKQVCRHCGYEYEEDGESVWFILGVIGSFILIIYILVTLTNWFTALDGATLFEVIKNQWEWVTELRIW